VNGAWINQETFVRLGQRMKAAPAVIKAAAAGIFWRTAELFSSRMKFGTRSMEFLPGS